MSLTIKKGLFKLGITDYHAILGVQINADVEEIRSRYLKIVPILHPDTCKYDNETRKEEANRILAQLINPAYRNLTTQNLRAEHLLLLAQKTNAMMIEKRQMTLSTNIVKILAKAGERLDEVYEKIINTLGEKEYSHVETIRERIAQISEINLVYLVLKEAKKQSQRKEQNLNQDSKVADKGAHKPQSKTENKEIETTESQINAYVKRAEEYKEIEKYKEAILELRDALKIDPNNSSCHGLLGLVYLEQNNTSMAKIHIDKAWQTNPNDNIVKEAKEKLDKNKKNTKAGPKKNKSALGRFSSLFSGKNK